MADCNVRWAYPYLCTIWLVSAVDTGEAAAPTAGEKFFPTQSGELRRAGDDRYPIDPLAPYPSGAFQPGVYRSCRYGVTNYCEAELALSGGLVRNGRFDAYMVAPAKCLIPLWDL